MKVIGNNVSGVQGDVAQLADLDRLYKRTVSTGEGERIDIVFANAGVEVNLFLWGRHRRAFRQTIQHQCGEIAVHGVKGLTVMLNDGGSIILNGSVASVKGTAAFGVYAASKAAIRSFVRTWTTDLKNRRIRSNVVSPGPINTPLAESANLPDVIARIIVHHPDGAHGGTRRSCQGGLVSGVG